LILIFFFDYLLGFGWGFVDLIIFGFFPRQIFKILVVHTGFSKHLVIFHHGRDIVFRHIRRRRRRRRFGVGDICGIILGQKSNFGDIFRGNKGGKKLRSQKRFAPRRD